MNTFGRPAQPFAHRAFELIIAAPPARVWDALIGELEEWWHPDFYMAGEGARMSFHARPGGQLLETTPGGGGILWATVFGMELGRSIDLYGQNAKRFGGPTVWMLNAALDDAGGGEATTLRIEHSLIGRSDPETVEAMDAGWRQLFSEGLQAYVERGSGA